MPGFVTTPFINPTSFFPQAKQALDLPAAANEDTDFVNAQHSGWAVGHDQHPLSQFQGAPVHGLLLVAGDRVPLFAPFANLGR
jgi:hypothetical protein